VSEWEGFGPLVSRAGPCGPKASTVGSRGLATFAVGSTPMKTASGPALARRPFAFYGTSSFVVNDDRELASGQTGSPLGGYSKCLCSILEAEAST
jgi:hypothetical protein